MLFFIFLILIRGYLLYNIVLVLPYINMNVPRVYMCSPSWNPFRPPSPYHPSGSSQCTSPMHPVSCSNPDCWFVSYMILHVSMPFSQIIPPSPSPTESKRLSYTSVSLLLSHNFNTKCIRKKLLLSFSELWNCLHYLWDRLYNYLILQKKKPI